MNPKLDAVEDAIRSSANTAERIGDVLRDTFDQLYNGQHTGRYHWDQLMKTEKTHMGTLVEINMQREFEWADGQDMDYEIAGVDVDCKYSQTLGGWEIPVEARTGKHICLVIWASEDAMKWEAGLIRVSEDPKLFNLEAAGNRDGKRKLSAAGESQIRWLFPGADLPPNQLLHMTGELRDEILAAGNHLKNGSGQQRIDMLCRRVQHEILRRGTILTVARQEDSLKRPRDSRLRLRPEGILVLGHQESHPDVARALGLPVPRKGQFISTRVVPAESSFAGPTAEIDGQYWRQATDDDPVVPAPLLPRKPRADGSDDG